MGGSSSGRVYAQTARNPPTVFIHPKIDSIYNSGGTPISLGALADLVREFIPDAQIAFVIEGGIEESDIYVMDGSRIREEFEVELPPLRQTVLEIINEVRQTAGMSLVRE